MTVKEHIIEQTERSVDALFRTARAIPEDKLEWKPLDSGRSALDQLRECAQSPGWSIHLMTERKLPEFSEENMKAWKDEQQSWGTLDVVEQVCRERTAQLIDTIRKFPDEHMEETMMLPFGEARYWTFRELMGLHRWNCDYHLGQISYIQTLYGDKEMR